MTAPQRNRIIVLIAFLLTVVLVNIRFISQRNSAPSLQLQSSNRGTNEFRLAGAHINPDQIKSIINANGFNLLLLHDGRVFAGGSHNKGQLGVGAKEVVAGRLYEINFPQPVVITDIQSVDSHTIALDTDGGVWTWGLNISGQIGNGSRKNQHTPTKVLDRATAVTAGYRFSAAIAQDGALWAWGMHCDSNNPELQLIIQQFAQSASAGGSYYGGVDVGDTQDCLNEQNLPIQSTTPKKVDGVPALSSLSGGYGHLVLLTKTGTIWTWGCNAYGQLGRENAQNNQLTQQPAELDTPDGARFNAISAGFRHSLAVDQNGAVWAWGHNAVREVSKTVTDTVTIPNRVDMDFTPHIVVAGHDTTAVLDTAQQLWAVGDNAVQRLKTNNDNYVTEFTRIAQNVQTFSLGRDSVVFLQKASTQ